MPKPPDMQVDLDTIYQVTIETDRGPIVMELDPKLAPKSVNHFVALARNGFYDGLTFHRVVPDFVIQGGDPEGSGRGGPGVYLVNTYNLSARPLYSLAALTLHESAPGHAFQMPLAQENKDLPPFRQRTYISAYGEGWALYCEKLGVEMGMYDTPYDRFGMLSYQMWRASRLVVDTGIHAMGWSREQAQRYLHDNTALADHEIETEVDRYIAWPGQALSYYLGERTILALRAKAEKALGPKFNIRAFHDTVLQMGSVPLPVLEARIDRFIADGGKGPYQDEE